MAISAKINFNSLELFLIWLCQDFKYSRNWTLLDRWRNNRNSAEISLKRQGMTDNDRENTRKDCMSNAIFRDTNNVETGSLIGSLSLSTTMNDRHLSTEEFFDSSCSGTRYVEVISGSDAFFWSHACEWQMTNLYVPLSEQNTHFLL